MAAFQIASTLVQSATGTTVVITDTSNYSDNDSNIELADMGVRSYVVTDGNGDAIASGNFATNVLTDEFDLAADAYLHTELSFILPDTSIDTASNNYLATNYYNYQLVQVAKQLTCDCDCGDVCDNTVKAMACQQAAVFYYLYGFAANAQELITDANTLIQS